MIAIHQLKNPDWCVELLAGQDPTLTDLFNRLIELGERALDTWQLAPAIAVPEAFGESVQHLFEFDFQPLELGTQNRLRDLRQDPPAGDQFRGFDYQRLQSVN